MGKEKKIGLSFIASLLVILGVLIVRRLMVSGETPTARVSNPPVTKATDDASPNLFNSPTLLETKAGSAQSGDSGATVATAKHWESNRKAHRDDAESRTSFLPQQTPAKHPAGRPTDAAHGVQPAPVPSGNPSKYAVDRYSLPEPNNAQQSDENDANAAVVTDEMEAAPEMEDAATAVNVEEASAAATLDASDVEVLDPSAEPVESNERAVQVAGKSEVPPVGGTSRYVAQAAPAARPAATPLPIQHGNVAHLTPARAPGAPTRANTGKYAVEPGDSFWRIAEKVYGDGGYFKALQEHNRGRMPNAAKLNVGDEILTPTIDALHDKYSGLCPKVRKAKPGTPQVTAVGMQNLRGGKAYVVEDGDTLYDIARFELGDAKRWPEIYQLNHAALGADIDFLRPGTRLVLPAGPHDEGDTLTRQPGDMLRR